MYKKSSKKYIKAFYKLKNIEEIERSNFKESISSNYSASLKIKLISYYEKLSQYFFQIKIYIYTYIYFNMM